MKYRTTPAFDNDWQRLKPEHRATFRAVMTKFIPTCDAWAAAMTAGGEFIWPKALRVSRLRGNADIWELTWSFASPDGRATFAFVRDNEEWFCEWRRVGDHGVFADP